MARNKKKNVQIVTPDGYTTNSKLGKDVWNGQMTLFGEVVSEDGFVSAEDNKTIVAPLASSSPVDAPDAPVPSSPAPSSATAKKTDWNTSRRVTCIWLKFYAEQCGFVPSGDQDHVAKDKFIEEQKLFISKALYLLSESKHDYYFHAIMHDKDDLQAEENDIEKFWNPEIEKPHVHLLIFYPNGGRIRISTLLSELSRTAGINFRHDKDTDFFYLGTKFPDMRKKEHIKAIVYHTHESDQAQEEEGKYEYDREECVTNIPKDVLDALYLTYFEQLSHQKPVVSVEYDMMIHARNLGRQAQAFNNWWFNQVAFNYRIPKNETRCRAEYEQGLSEFLESPQSKFNMRCSIFIQGDHNLGKTVTSKLVLENMGLRVYVVEAGRTNKFDELDVRHQAMVISDTGCDDLLAVADNNFCRVYKRVSGSPIWAGSFLIITYNGTFQQYCDEFAPGKNYSALLSRFYVCHLSESAGLKCIKPQTRGDKQSLFIHNQMFKKFADGFNNCFWDFLKNRPDETNAIEEFANMMPELYDPYAGQILSGIPTIPKAQPFECTQEEIDFQRSFGALD